MELNSIFAKNCKYGMEAIFHSKEKALHDQDRFQYQRVCLKIHEGTYLIINPTLHNLLPGRTHYHSGTTGTRI
ncbi:MAG TPA: hypothetical protein VG847_12525 [Chitinophagaceae bacterium]|nr:hypothetical protein [Chitinophagaceae bacterium]